MKSSNENHDFAIGNAPRTAGECVILHVNSIPKCHEAFENWEEGALFWFFARRYGDFLNLQRHLPDGAELAPVGKKINAIAQAIRGEFNELDAQIANAAASELDILSSDLVERNPYVGSLFLLSCQYIAFLDALKQGGRHIFVIDDLQVARLLYNEARRLGVDVGWQAQGRSRSFGERLGERQEALKGIVRGMRTRVGGVLRLARHVSRLRRMRKSIPVPVAKLRDADVLIVTWTRKITFSTTQPTSRATSLGRLPQLIREDVGRKIGFISLPLSWLDSYADIAANALHAHDAVLLFEDALSYRDIIMAGWRSLFAVNNLGDHLILQGKDLSAVLRLEKKREWGSWRPANVSLYAKLGSYLRVQGIVPRAIVYLYEHQSWEKCLLQGVRTNLPGVRMIACQQSAFAAQHLNLYPSHRDVDNTIAPDALLVSGPRFVDIMKPVLGTKTLVRNVGAIRYEGHLPCAQTSRDHIRKTGSYVSVLCVTNSDMEDCCELVVKVAMAAQSVGVRVVVNFHPFTDDHFRATVKESVAMNCSHMDHVDFLTVPAADLMNEVDGVFYSDTNAAFEAMSKGLPIVHVQRAFALDYNQVPEDFCTVVRHTDEIQSVLLMMVNDELKAQSSSKTQAGVLASLGPIDHAALAEVIGGFSAADGSVSIDSMEQVG